MIIIGAQSKKYIALMSLKNIQVKNKVNNPTIYRRNLYNMSNISED